MRKYYSFAVILFIVSMSWSARAELLVSESFDGPYNFVYHNGIDWITIQNSSSISNWYWTEAKSDLGKSVGGAHSGNNSIRLCGEYQGGTCEFWTKDFSPNRDEIWVTWWEKLSSTYDINEGHKWFEVDLTQDGTTPFLMWQTWEGTTDKDLASRWYNGGSIVCSEETFATTTHVTLPSEQWYQWKLHIRLNTVGQSNGVFQVWVKTDGVHWTPVWDLQNANNIRCNVDRKIKSLRFNGTRQRSSGESSHGTKWIDDIKIGTTEADVDSNYHLSVPTDFHASSIN